MSEEKVAKDPLRIGLVGMGDLGQRYLKAVDEVEGAVVAGCADCDWQKALKQVGRQLPVYRSSRDLSPLVDAVVVNTPAHSHTEIIQDALARDCHVLVETPLATSVESAAYLQQEAAGSSRVLKVGNVFAYQPPVRILNRLLQSETALLLDGTIHMSKDASADLVFDRLAALLDLCLRLTVEAVDGHNTPGPVAAGAPVEDRIRWEQGGRSVQMLTARLQGGTVVRGLAAETRQVSEPRLQVFTDVNRYSMDLGRDRLSIGGAEPLALGDTPVLDYDPLDAAIRRQLSVFLQAVERRHQAGDVDPLDLIALLQSAERTR